MLIAERRARQIFETGGGSRIMNGLRKAKLGIGVIGCGNISMTYLRNAALFAGVKLVACADIAPEMAALRAMEYGIRAMT
eukprot:gene13939-18460_t